MLKTGGVKSKYKKYISLHKENNKGIIILKKTQ